MPNWPNAPPSRWQVTQFLQRW